MLFWTCKDFDFQIDIEPSKNTEVYVQSFYKPQRHGQLYKNEGVKISNVFWKKNVEKNLLTFGQEHGE